MCGRYYIASDDVPEELERIIAAINRTNARGEVKTSGEIFPSDTVPVIANNRRREVQPFAMRWGYTRDAGGMVINARCETAAQRPLFRDGMAQRRCLIPASNYFEWEHSAGRKLKYAIRPADSRVLYLAGIYRIENRMGAAIPCFTVLTRPAAAGIEFIHDRMPVMLAGDSRAQWLDMRVNAEDAIAAAVENVEFWQVEG